MDFKPTLNEVLYTPRQRAIKEKLNHLLGQLEIEYRKTDPEFSLSNLKACDLILYANGTNIFRISSTIALELQQRLHAIGEQIMAEE
jgi:hypothetical protein